MKGQPAAGQPEHIPRAAAGELRPVEGDKDTPRAHDAAQQRHQGVIQHRVGTEPLRLRLALHQPENAHQEAQGEHYPVGVNADGADCEEHRVHSCSLSRQASPELSSADECADARWDPPLAVMSE